MIRFGHCTLDEGRGVLIAPDGSETPLRPKTHELLRLLLKHPGRVVPRAEILDAVWPGIFVTDDSITQCVVELRKAMGPGGAALLRTLPRRGYLLQADVIAEAVPEPAPAGRSDDRPSIAVLPFRKERGDADVAYFEDGIIEGIVHVLSGLERILVISRGSALAVAEQTTDPREVGRRLGVRYVLHGGVRRAGERLRITTELSEAETGSILRTDKYDGDASDLFALQDRIAEGAAAAVAPQIRELELARALRKPPAQVTSYDLVLRALDLARRVDRTAMAEAEELLARAVAAEPDYATARSYLAFLRMLSISEGWTDPVNGWSEAAQHAEKAVELNPADPIALAIRGHAMSYLERNYAGASRLLERAMRLGPSCAWAWAWASVTASYLGQAAEAVHLAERGLRLSPLDPFSYVFEHLVSQAYHIAGEHDAAVFWARRSAAANPRHGPNRRVLIASLVALGQRAEASAAAASLMRDDPSFTISGFARRTPLPGPILAHFCERLKMSGLPA